MKFISIAINPMKAMESMYNGFEPKNTVPPTIPGKGNMYEIAIARFIVTSGLIKGIVVCDANNANRIFTNGPTIAIFADSISVRWVNFLPILYALFIVIFMEVMAAKNICLLDRM